MNSKKYTAAMTAALCAAFLASPATAVTGGSRVSDSTTVPLRINHASGAPAGICTGEIIASQWILTAKHCTKDVSSINAFYTNDINNLGAPAPIDSYVASPSGDVVLLHLKSPAPVTTYAKLSTAVPPVGADLRIEGYGTRYGVFTDGLYGAQVKITSSGTDQYGGPAYWVQGITGSASTGDSGGPLLYNGAVIGITSGGGAGTNTSITAMSTYAKISAHRAWIYSVAGV